jgi:N-acyl-D-amino-acid deacylase
VQAETVIDARGKVVSPGFIDMHSHEDATNIILPTADSFVYQGITTAVSGNCGVSLAPFSEMIKEQAASLIGKKNYENVIWRDEWKEFGPYLEDLRKLGSSLNSVPLVGQGAVRAAVMGMTAGRPSEEQMEQMQRIVIECMDSGAFGISTGLIYTPGSYTSTEELIEVTRPAAERGGIYASHVRGEGDTLLKAIEEEIAIARATGAAVEHSHYKAMCEPNWNLAEQGLEMIEKARAEGIDMTADMYLYVAGSTRMAALLPDWAQEGGMQAIAGRLMDADMRVKMAHSMQTEGVFRVDDWSSILVSGSANPVYVGHNIAELAENAGKTPSNWFFDALLETRGEIAIILFTMTEENVKMQLQRSWMMIGTDGWGLPFEGPLAAGAPHPRGMGNYPRLLGKYVREEEILGLEEAIHRCTGLPAEKLKLGQRGLLKEGYYADVVVFNPDTVIDKADFINPYQKPAGIDEVLVNGKLVIHAGQHTQALPGEVLTRR